MAKSRHVVLSRVQRVMRAFLPQEEDFFYLFGLAGDKAVEAAECLHSLMNNYQRLDGAVEDIDKMKSSSVKDIKISSPRIFSLNRTLSSFPMLRFFKKE